MQKNIRWNNIDITGKIERNYLINKQKLQLLVMAKAT